MIEIQKAPSDKERTNNHIKANQDNQCAKNILALCYSGGFEPIH